MDYWGCGIRTGRRRVEVWNGKIGNLRSLAFGYVQREDIPADLPVKATDDVDQGGGCGSWRWKERVLNL